MRAPANQAHVTNLDASPYVGRLALCRVHEGTIRKGQTVAWCQADGGIGVVQVGDLLAQVLQEILVQGGASGPRVGEMRGGL